MKKITFLLLTVACFLSGCTFGNQSSTGTVFGDYVFSIIIAIGAIVCAINAVMYFNTLRRTGKKDTDKKIWAFVGIIVAIAFYLFAKLS